MLPDKKEILAAVLAVADPAPLARASVIPRRSDPRQDSADVASAREEGFAEGVRAERLRIAAILNNAAACGRESLARHLAFNTSMAPTDAVAALNAAAQATPAQLGKSEYLRGASRARELLDARARESRFNASGCGGVESSEREKGAVIARALLGK